MTAGQSVAARTLSGFRAEIQRARHLIALNAAFSAFVRQHGFTAYAVGFVPGQPGGDKPFLLLEWPRAWLELYAREGFVKDDAVVASAATATTPFTWLELQAQQPGASARVFEAARGFGWGDGFLVPVRVEDGAGATRLGVVSLAAPSLASFSARARQEVATASELALRRAVELEEHPVPLTRREREALAHVAAGRNDRDIAGAMGVSTATAHAHVESAKRKLGAATRAQAVALASGRLP